MWGPAGGRFQGRGRKLLHTFQAQALARLGCSTFLCTKAFSSVATLLEFLPNPLTFNSVGPVKPTADLLASVSYKKHSEVVISPGIFFVLACMYSE